MFRVYRRAQGQPHTVPRKLRGTSRAAGRTDKQLSARVSRRLRLLRDLAGSVFGTNPNGFWNHPEWPRVLGRIVNWINRGARIMEKDFVSGKTGR